MENCYVCDNGKREFVNCKVMHKDLPCGGSSFVGKPNFCPICGRKIGNKTNPITIFEKLQDEKTDIRKMARILHELIEEQEYEWCSESVRRGCDYDAHSCNECIHVKLKEKYKGRE